MTEPTVITEGVPHCACVTPASMLGGVVIATGKLLPGAWMDGHIFDYGEMFAVAAKHSDGRRRAVKFAPTDVPAIADLAEALA